MAKTDVSAAQDFLAVTTSDSADVTGAPFRALYIGVSGDVVINNGAGTAITFKTVPIGIFPVSGSRVRTATTATNIVALF